MLVLKNERFASARFQPAAFFKSIMFTKLLDVKPKRRMRSYAEKLRHRFVGNLALGIVAMIVMLGVTRC